MQSPGLYIHVPFCRSKCPYCDFFSIASASLIPRWLEAFKKEVCLYKEQFDCFDSLYLGGGTPSSLDLNDLEELLDNIFTHLKFAPDTEITIEANPGELTDDFISGIESMGFNRVNLGVQSFDDTELAFLGRRHKVADAERALELLRSSGIENMGIDLIYGLKEQTLDRWMESLKKALRYRPEHISCYQLTIEKRTPFWKMQEKGLLTPMSEEKGRAFFFLTSEFMEENGYIHYEISNFAEKECYRSRHNSKYWNHSPYLGLGPSAHSFQGSKRWWNFRSIRRYCEALERDRVPVEGDETLTEGQMRLEAVSLGLRTMQGVDLSEVPHSPELEDVISRLRESGHVRMKGNRVIPTREGFLVADRLPLCFFPAGNSHNNF